MVVEWGYGPLVGGGALNAIQIQKSCVGYSSGGPLVGEALIAHGRTNGGGPTA